MSKAILDFFIFNYNVKNSLYHAYFACIHVAVSKQKVYHCCKNSLEKSESDIMLNLFAYSAMINILQKGMLAHNFWNKGSIDTLALFTDCTVLADCCYGCIVCICLLV